MSVSAHIDAAAYGRVHTNSGRSHMGCTIVSGVAATVFAKSVNQKNAIKSRIEAELVATAADSASQAIHTRNFVDAQGCALLPCVIYQETTR